MPNIDSETIAIVSDLIRGLRHELGNLATVLTFDISQIESLMASQQAPSQAIQELKADIGGLYEILQRLKQYPQPLIETAEFDAVRVLDETVEQCRAQTASEVPVTLKAALPFNEIWVNGDDSGLHSVFSSVISNAIEASRQTRHATNGPTVDVSLQIDHDHVVILVADNGVGLTADQLANVFKPSFTTRITDGFMRGLGLGLFSARAIVHLHGGTIALENRLIKNKAAGALVTIRLPLPAGAV